MTAIAGAVLCGGASRRMGRDKALIELDGVMLAERVARVLEAAGCDPVVFVGGDAARLGPPTGRTVVADGWPGQGPAGGVLTALGHFAGTDADTVVVAACDLVTLSTDAVAAVMSASPDAVTIADSGRPEPMLARWRVSCAAAVESAFATERSLLGIATALGAARVAVDAAAMRNANDPADLEA
jgi:molybdopterin-guanine dinucleotide biosynthesis protein A